MVEGAPADERTAAGLSVCGAPDRSLPVVVGALGGRGTLEGRARSFSCRVRPARAGFPVVTRA